MREKIAEIVDKIDIVCGFEGEDSLCRESISCNACITDRLLALFTAETQRLVKGLILDMPITLYSKPLEKYIRKYIRSKSNE